MKNFAALDKARLGSLAVMLALAVVAAWLFGLHAETMQWRDPGLGRWLATGLSVSIWMGFVVMLRRRRARVSGMSLPVVEETEANAILAAYASQTGYAEQLARQTAQSLLAAKLPVRLAELGGLDVPALRAAGRVLFVVSTTGEGDAPDSAASFEQRCLRQAGELDGLRYGLLALGDRDYENFCGFGHRLHHWLAQSGAQPLFDPVEVDNGDVPDPVV